MLLGAPAGAVARPLPDLKPTGVRALRAEVAPGALLRVRDRVRNVGRATSRRFSVRFLLSADRRRGRDIALRGGRRVRRLRPRRTTVRSTRVRVPLNVRPGRYMMFVCADSRRRVRERRERNNCRRSARRLSVRVPPGALGAPSTTPPGPDPLVAAVGDVACDPADAGFNGGQGTASRCRQAHVARLVPGASQLFALGDLQYEQATSAQFAGSWNLSFGPYRSITRPVIGNHEYDDPAGGARGYFDYFNGPGNATGPAGDRSKGYYSFDVGDWHVVALNSNCDEVSCDPGSAQETWLRADLSARPARCTAALWHHPRFSSVTDLDRNKIAEEPRMASLWRALREAGADVVLSGHSHNYERFAPMTETGAASANGLREFVVGTGGRNHHPFLYGDVYSTSEKRDAAHFGLLRLRLGSTGYDWTFVDEGGVARDSGSASCR